MLNVENSKSAAIESRVRLFYLLFQQVVDLTHVSKLFSEWYNLLLLLYRRILLTNMDVKIRRCAPLKYEGYNLLTCMVLHRTLPIDNGLNKGSREVAVS